MIGRQVSRGENGSGSVNPGVLWLRSGRRRVAAWLSFWGAPEPGPRFVALAAGVLLSLGIWRLSADRGGPSFPRREDEFLSSSALTARIEEASKRLVENPQDIRALSELGVLHFQRGRESYADAINELEDARKLGAMDHRHLYYLGVMYQAEGLYPFAIAEYQKFLRHAPQDGEARLSLAKLLFQGGQVEEAAAHFKRLMEGDSRDPVVIENLGLSLKMAKRRDDAVQAFQALAALGGPQLRRADLHLGRMAAEDGDHRAAMRHFVALLPLEGQAELGAEPVTLHAEIAANYEKLRSPKLAREHWQMVLGYDAKNPQARKAIAAIEAAQRRAARQSKRRK